MTSGKLCLAGGESFHFFRIEGEFKEVTVKN